MCDRDVTHVAITVASQEPCQRFFFFFSCTVQKLTRSADINGSWRKRRFINTDLALHSPTLQSWLIKVLYVCLAAPPQFLQFISEKYIFLYLFSSIIFFHSLCRLLPSFAYVFFIFMHVSPGCSACVKTRRGGSEAHWDPQHVQEASGGQQENPQKLMNMLNMRWPRALFSVCVYVCCQDALCTASATGCPSWWN